MRILIVRHGDPDYEHNCLTEKGKREAELLSERLFNENIKKAYLSPYGRADQTAHAFLDKTNIPYETHEFLKEFPIRVKKPNKNEETCMWDFLPSFVEKNPAFFKKEEWYKIPIIAEANAKELYDKTVEDFDEIIASHGYKRNGIYYDAVNSNTDTIAFFCHFGIESVLLSHLFNCAPHILLQNTLALTSSVTTLVTEEREKGKAFFRMIGFGDISHLYGREEPSFQGRFCETFDSPERH